MIIIIVRVSDKKETESSIILCLVVNLDNEMNQGNAHCELKRKTDVERLPKESFNRC